jgi:hypothetical protein
MLLCLSKYIPCDTNVNRKNKLFYWSILEEKIYAFKHDIKTKDIGTSIDDDFLHEIENS